MGDEIATLRAFNRLYTQRLGLLDDQLDRSPFTLSEARVLYELAHRERATAADIGRSLKLDRAQISRTLKRFADRGLVEARPNPDHGRQQWLSLTNAGRAIFATVNGNTQRAIGDLLETLPPLRRDALMAGAAAITRAFDAAAPDVRLRGLEPGDLGLVAARQMRLYAQDYGWNEDYEALVLRILADFHDAFDPARDDAWIAEIDGVMAGSIFLVHGVDAEVAKLRLLYVEPRARGLGIGRLLVRTCLERARALRYRRIDLWTNDILTEARALYIREGFTLVEEEPHHSFGRDLLGQTWTLPLH